MRSNKILFFKSEMKQIYFFLLLTLMIRNHNNYIFFIIFYRLSLSPSFLTQSSILKQLTKEIRIKLFNLFVQPVLIIINILIIPFNLLDVFDIIKLNLFNKISSIWHKIFPGCSFIFFIPLIFFCLFQIPYLCYLPFLINQFSYHQRSIEKYFHSIF